MLRNGGRTLGLGVLAAAVVVSALAVPPPASAQRAAAAPLVTFIGPPIAGTITWTKVTEKRYDASNEYGVGDLITSTTTDTGTLRVVFRRNGKFKKGFVIENAGSTHESRVSGDEVGLSRTYDGAVRCTSTTTLAASSRGSFLPADGDAIAPTITGFVVPSADPPALGRRTKVIALMPMIMNAGTTTSTYSPSDPTHCPPDSVGQPVEMQALWGDTVPQCLPVGVSPRSVYGINGALFGAWRNASKTFVFDCIQEYPVDYGTVRLTIKGSLRYG
jgi:hypothetical protein